MDPRSRARTWIAAVRHYRLVVILGLLLAVGLAVSLASFALAADFPDVPTSDPYYAAMADLSSRGIIGGYANGNFGPGDPVTRQQFAKMIVLTGAYPVSESDVCPFSDVAVSGPASLYPDNYVAVCAAKGITTGKNAATFDPSGNITRFQAVSMVVRMADDLRSGLLATPPAGWSGSTNWAGNGTHSAGAARAEYGGLLSGLDPGSLDPYGNMSRGEVAQVLHNLLGLLGSGSGVPATTKILSAAALSALQSVSVDRSVLVFSASPSVPSLAPGDIIVAGVSAATPYGLLQKVVSVSRTGDATTVQTTTATLQEAAPQGSFDTTATLTPDNVEAAGLTWAQPNGAQPIRASGLTTNLGVTFSHDNWSMGAGSVSLSESSIRFEAAPGGALSCNWNPKDFKLSWVVSVQELANLKVTVTPGASGSQDWDIAPATYFEPITVLVPTPIGPLPVVLLPKLEWKASLSVDLSEGPTLTVSATQKCAVKAGVKIDHGTLSLFKIDPGQVTLVKDFSNTFSDPNVSSGFCSASGNVRVSAGPVFTVLLYGVAGPEANLDGFLDLRLQSSAPWCALTGGLEAGVGLNIPAFDLSIGDPDLLEWSEPIFASICSGLPDCPLVKVPEPPTDVSAHIECDDRVLISWTYDSSNVVGFIVTDGITTEDIPSRDRRYFVWPRADDNITRHFRVCAYNSAGQSVWSDWVPVTVPEVPDYTCDDHPEPE